MMKTMPLATAMALLAASALAQPRPQSVAMGCPQAAELVTARGAIVLGTGGFTYDRFVRDRSFCEITQTTEVAFVPTLDNPYCFVGYRCKERDVAEQPTDQEAARRAAIAARPPSSAAHGLKRSGPCRSRPRRCAIRPRAPGPRSA
jgi:hypothetical protein